MDGERKWCSKCLTIKFGKTCVHCGSLLISILDKDGALSEEFLLSRGECCDRFCKNCPWKKS